MLLPIRLGSVDEVSFSLGITWIYLGFSKNRGTPKSSILIRFSIIFTIHFGGPPLFLEASIWYMIFHKQNDSFGMLHQKCPTENDRTIFILQRALISITSPCVQISTSQQKLPPSKHPNTPWVMETPQGSNVRWDGRYCLLNGFLETSVAKLQFKQGHSSPSNCIACMDMIPITNLHRTCGDVTSYRYASRFKDFLDPLHRLCSCNKTSALYSSMQSSRGTQLAVWWLLIDTYWRQMPRFWSNPFQWRMPGM